MKIIVLVEVNEPNKTFTGPNELNLVEVLLHSIKIKSIYLTKNSIFLIHILKQYFSVCW